MHGRAISLLMLHIRNLGMWRRGQCGAGWRFPDVIDEEGKVDGQSIIQIQTTVQWTTRPYWKPLMLLQQSIRASRFRITCASKAERSRTRTVKKRRRAGASDRITGYRCCVIPAVWSPQPSLADRCLAHRAPFLRKSSRFLHHPE